MIDFLLLPYQYIFSLYLIKKVQCRKSTNKKLIILQVDSFDKGGLEEVVYAVAKNIKKKSDYEIAIFVKRDNNGYLYKKATNDDIMVINLKNNKFFLRLLIKKLHPTIVNFHYGMFGFQEYYKSGIILTYTIHNNYIWLSDKEVQKRGKNYEKIDKFFSVSSQVKSFFCQNFSIDSERVVVIPNGIDVNIFNEKTIEKREKYNINKTDFLFINVASFTLNKNHVLMIEALKLFVQKHQNAKMLFVGNILDQRCFEYVVRLINLYGLNNYVRIIDFVPNEKVYGLMLMSNCFIFPSITEGWGIVTTEAMMCELPVILSDVGGSRDLVHNNDVGIVIRSPFFDMRVVTNDYICNYYYEADKSFLANELCDAMDNIYVKYEEWKLRAKDGRKRIENDFNIDRMISSYVREFDKLLHKK